MSSYLPRSLIGQVRDENANWDLTTRPAMFPFLADYTNRNTGEHAGGMAVPSMVTEPMNALMRLFGTPEHPGTFGQGPDVGIEWDNPVRSQYPAQEDMRTLLETSLGGNATRGMGAVEKGAAALSDTTPSVPGAVVASQTAPIRAYRGFGSGTPGIGPQQLTTPFDKLFMTSSPDVAGTYANVMPDGTPAQLEFPAGGAVAPLDLHFKNPLITDAGGRSWSSFDDPFTGGITNANYLAEDAAMRGHDGLIINNVHDSADLNGRLPSATTYVALSPGTVRSPLTGETLFSDQLPSLWGASVQGQQQHPNSLFAQNSPGAGDYLKDRTDKPWQPAPGEDFQYEQDPQDVKRLQDWVGRHERHDLPKAQADELMKKDPEYQRLYNKLWEPKPFNPNR